MAVLIETDARKRVSLAKLGVTEASYFLAEQRADGSILLVPAEVRPKALDIVDRVSPNWQSEAATVTDPTARAEWDEIRADSLSADDG